jgi:hypothetical protein
MIYADTLGLLDRCRCGAIAGFETNSMAGETEKVRARCTECCEQTEFEECKYCASFTWNDLMRGNSNPTVDPRTTGKGEKQ